MAGVCAESLECRRLFAEVQVRDVLVNEGAAPAAVFTVEVAPGDLPVTLDYATVESTATPGGDFTPGTGTLTFPASAEPRTQSVTVPVADDAFWEETEWFYLELSNGTNAELPGGADTYRATATVRDDDPRPVIRVSDVRVDEGDAADTQAVFAVTLSRAHDVPVTVDFAAAARTATAGDDFLPASGTLTFAPGETTKPVAVTVRGDTVDENDETFVLNLRAATVALLEDAQGTATIDEDDDRRPTADVVNVSPDPRAEAVASVRIAFSEPVAGLDLADLSLARAGAGGATTGNLLTAAQTLSTADGGVTWTLGNLAPLSRAAGQYTLALAAAGTEIADPGGNALAGGASDTWRTFAAVAGRRVFYNNSFFDGNDRSASAADDSAVAPDKSALLPGQTPTFANVTSFTRGLNGVIVDVAGLPPEVTPAPADFTTRVGTGGDPSGWAAGPVLLSATVRRGAGTGGADRVTLVFADGAVTNAWLRVTVLPTERTGLASPDVFTFGNLVGETGAAPPLTVDSRDYVATRRLAWKGPAPLTSVADHNRDGRVNALDLAVARSNVFSRLSAPTATTVSAARADQTAAVSVVATPPDPILA